MTEFTARVQALGRVVIPEEVRIEKDIEQGDRVKFVGELRVIDKLIQGPKYRKVKDIEVVKKK